MKIKILLFLSCFTANIYCQEFTIKCPIEKCTQTLTSVTQKELAFLILNHIYSNHSHPMLYEEATTYAQTNYKITPEGTLNMKCPNCSNNFYANTISDIVHSFIVHRFTTRSHNGAGFRNMMEYVSQSKIVEKSSLDI